MGVGCLGSRIAAGSRVMVDLANLWFGIWDLGCFSSSFWLRAQGLRIWKISGWYRALQVSLHLLNKTLKPKP